MSALAMVLYLFPLTRPLMRAWAHRNLPMEMLIVDRATSERSKWVVASGRIYRIDGPTSIGPNMVRRLSERRFLVAE